MQCCPVDIMAKKEWEDNLLSELVIPLDEIDRMSRIFKVLSHPLRLKIAFLLLGRDHCVCELVYLLDEKQNLISHHLSIMKKQDMVEAYSASGWKYYRLGDGVGAMLRHMGESAG